MSTNPFAMPAQLPTVVLADFLKQFHEVVDEYDGWVVTCPAHEDNSPSLRIALNAENHLLLHCRAGCAKDSVLDALGLAKAALFNVNLTGMNTVHSHVAPPAELGASDRAALAGYLHRAKLAFADDAGERARVYAMNRFGVSENLGISLGLGYDDGTLPAGELKLSRTMYRAHPRLVVPFRTFDGSPAGLQARALTVDAPVRWSGPVNPSQGVWSCYGVFQAEAGLPDTDVIITEGPGDALTVVAIGYDAVFVRGAALASSQSLADELAAGLRKKRVVVAGDDDPAGRLFTERVCEALSQRGVETHKLLVPESLDITAWRERDPQRFATEFQLAVRTAPVYGEDEILADRLRAQVATILTDVENARALRRFILSKGCDIRYAQAVEFIVYRGHAEGVWKVDDADWVRTQAHAAVPYIQRTMLEQIHQIEARAMTISDDATRTNLISLTTKLRDKVHSSASIGWSMSSRGIDAMIRELRALDGVAIDYTSFDRHPNLLAVANGVVNLETKELQPYSDDTKALYLMRKVHYPYDPTATNPRWSRFIEEIADDRPELVTYLQALIGYSITGHNTEQAVAVMLGGGANGKSVFMETLTHIFQELTVVTPFSTFERRDTNSGGASPDIARLAGARLVIASEGDAGRPMAEALLKRLSGSESVTARFLYRAEFTFVPTALICLVSNHPPVFRGQDHGIWRRIRLIPFTRKFEGQAKDPHLFNKFIGARVPSSAWFTNDDMGDGPAGILAWAVEGAGHWFEHGLQEPAIVRVGTEEFKETSDQLGDYINEYLVREADSRISVKDAFGLYLAWAEEENLSGRDVWKRKTFIQAMEERGARVYTLNGAKTFRGFRKKTPADKVKTTETVVFSTFAPPADPDDND